VMTAPECRRPELVEPGLSYVTLWRPEGSGDLFLDETERCPGYAAVGRAAYVSAA
jgi:hypothetical protein